MDLTDETLLRTELRRNFDNMLYDAFFERKLYIRKQPSKSFRASIRLISNLDDCQNSMSHTIKKYSDFDYRSIKFSHPSKVDKFYTSVASCGDNDSNKEPLYIQVPLMKLADIEIPQDVSKSFIDLEVDDNEYYQWLRYLDTYIVQHIFKNRESWFNNSDVNMAVVEDSYRSPLRRGQESGAEPIVRFKLNSAQDAIHTTVYQNRKRAEIESLDQDKKPNVVCIVELRGLTLFKDSICPDWVVHTVRVIPEKSDNSGCLFDD